MMKVLSLLLFFVVFAVANSSLRCGEVFDGLNQDVDEISAGLSHIQVSWSGFEDGKERNRIVRYEWAIASSTQVKAVGCRDVSGINGVPEVSNWNNVGTMNSGSGVVRLVAGEKYYTVVRATTAFGVQKYKNSDGFVAVERIEHDKSTRSVVEQPQSRKRILPDNLTFNGDCPIDNENRCNAAAVSVRERLSELYGTPQFEVFAYATAFAIVPPGALGTREGVNDDDDSDDDDDEGDLNVGTIIGIAIGVTIFFCLLAIGVIIISGFTGKGREFKTNIKRHENVEEF